MGREQFPKRESMRNNVIEYSRASGSRGDTDIPGSTTHSAMERTDDGMSQPLIVVLKALAT